MKKNLLRNYFKSTGLIFIVTFCNSLTAQIPPNAVNADPSAKSISQSPLGQNINGTAVLKFKFTNEATSVNATGEIPPNSVRLTISFPGKYAYTSVNSIPKFFVEDFDDQPFGAVHLVNNQTITEGEVIDLLLNVRGTSPGTGTVTFNSDRVTPITVANTQTANDNASSSFTTSSVLPVVLQSFSAKDLNCTTALNWKTATETNFKKFDLEYSKDGEKFLQIATFKSMGSNSSYQYSNNSMQGKIFYRLKMINEDGVYSYSDILPINSTCIKNNSSVYPNPVADILNITVNTFTNTATGLLFDNTGKKIMDVKLRGGLNQLNVKSLQSGIYNIIINNGISKEKFQIVVQ